MPDCLKIRCNGQRLPEKRYILDVLLGEILGLNYTLHTDDTLRSYVVETGTGSIHLPDIFLSMPEEAWLQPSSVPGGPFPEWDLSAQPLFKSLRNTSLPVLFGNAETTSTTFPGNSMSVPADIFGTAFFMLSRYEEMVTPEKDEHKRFPFNASVLRFNNLVERPLVNEYIEVLWRMFHFLNASLQRKQHTFTVIPSCDVDWPYDPQYYGLRGAYGVLRRWKRPAEMLRQAFIYAKVTLGGWKHDPYNTFAFMMDTFERNRLKGAFYFICDNSRNIIDGVYKMNEPRIRELLTTISRRGHEIGLHLSYDAYNTLAYAQKEYDTLAGALKSLKLEQPVEGGRQHFLRWENPATPVIWDTLGMRYDSTLAFAEQAGFRCGICHDYSMWDIASRRPLSLKQRPLVVMECSVIDGRYMNMGFGEEAYRYMLMLKDTVRHYNGNFTILWHNSHFSGQKEMNLFERILSKD